MDTLKAIATRRSIRKYKDKPVSDELIQKIIEAGMYAPSAGNQQPWHFMVIRDRKVLTTIPQYHPHAQMLMSAQAAILLCGDLSLEKHKGYWVQDCAACVQNMLLGAHAQKLGAVWLGVYPRQDRVDAFKKLFRLPEQVIPFALVPVGYPDEQKEQANRFHASRIHHEQWE